MEQNLFNQNQSKEISIFNFENQNVRTVIIDSEIWFVASDVTKILGYQNGRKAIDDHCLKGVTKKYSLLTKGGNQELTIINESGIYQLVMASMPSSLNNELLRRFFHLLERLDLTQSLQRKNCPSDCEH